MVISFIHRQGRPHAARKEMNGGPVAVSGSVSAVLSSGRPNVPVLTRQARLPTGRTRTSPPDLRPEV